MNPPPGSETARLVHALADGIITAEEHRRLATALRASAADRRLYVEMLELHNLLELEAEEASVALPAQLIPIEMLLRKQRRQSVRRAMVAAVAALVAGGVFLHRLLVPDPAPPVEVRLSADAEAHFTHARSGREELPEGVLARGSSLRLARGAVELAFESGVRSVVQAPASIRLLKDDRLGVTEGVAWVHVPAPAVGFQVATGELLVTDLGTEFGVVATPGEPDEVHVFAGKVEAVGLAAGSKPVVLAATTARRLSDAGGLLPIEPRPERFRKACGTPSVPHLHWSFDECDADRQSVRGNHHDLPAITSRCMASDGGAPFADFSCVPGRFGNALSSLSRGGRVETNWPGVRPGTPFTVAFWVKVPPGHQATQNLVGWATMADDPGTAPAGFMASVHNPDHGCVAVLTLGGAVYCGRTPLDDGAWHHLALIVGGPGARPGEPGFSCLLDGRPDTMTRGAADMAPVGLAATHRGGAPAAFPLTMLADAPRRERLDQDLTLALARDHGTTHVFLNGTRIGFSTGASPGLGPLTTLTIGANRHPSDRLEGFFTGSIDRVRLSTFKGSLGSGGLLGASEPAFTVVADYTFDDNRIPPGFATIGDPECAGGRLVLDGDDALELVPTPLAAADNFIIEARLSMSRFPSGRDNFAFPVSNSNGRNGGWGLVFQDTWGGIIMGLRPVGSASASHGGDASVALDELHIFEAALTAQQLAALHQANDPAPAAGAAPRPQSGTTTDNQTTQ